MSEITLLYLLAAVLFIVGLKQLSTPRTARRGNAIAGAGMLLAMVVTWSTRTSPGGARSSPASSSAPPLARCSPSGSR
jgi:NAD/NADP transhydrogenase beta subunit